MAQFVRQILTAISSWNQFGSSACTLRHSQLNIQHFLVAEKLCPRAIPLGVQVSYGVQKKLSYGSNLMRFEWSVATKGALDCPIVPEGFFLLHFDCGAHGLRVGSRACAPVRLHAAISSQAGLPHNARC